MVSHQEYSKDSRESVLCGAVQGAGGAQGEEKEPQGNLLALPSSLTGGCTRAVRLFSQGAKDRTKGNGPKLC